MAVYEAEYYWVRYGDKQLVIIPDKGLLYFGGEREALNNWKKEYLWVACRRKKIK